MTPWLGIIGIACAPPTTQVDPQLAVDRLFRASVLIRSRPPSESEIERVLADPGRVADTIRSFSLDAATVGALVRDLHALDLFVRNDLRLSPPARGPLYGTPISDLVNSLDDAPLALVEHIVTNRRPYTEIVTADYVVADPIVSAAWGPRVDRENPAWQLTEWHDDRPRAGLLSSTTMWMRHPSGNLNHHRSRAAIVADALLCDDVTTRAAAGAFDPTFQEEAVKNDPGCISCHASLDPLASAFWGFRPYVLPLQITEGYDAGCYPGDDYGVCYPVPIWESHRIDDGAALGMPAAALYGHPVGGLQALGTAIAKDPRFSTCTAQRFWSFLARIPREDVPPHVVGELAQRLVASDYDAGALLLDVVAHPEFGTTPATIRPGHLARVVEQLTGYRWQAYISEPYGVVDLARSDRHGLNILMGGLDGWRITGNEPGALPVRELALDWLAEEAAIHAIETELSGEERDLFREGVPTDEQSARAQLTWWHLRILGEPDASTDADWALLQQLLADGSPERAWTILLSAMLRHPRLVVL